MTGAVAGYAYLHARASVLSEALRRPADLERLIDCAPEEEAGLLRAAGLVPREVAPQTESAALEQWLIDALVADFTVLARALAGMPRELLVYWARRFELSNLKAILRGQMTGQPAEKIRENLLDIGAFATLPVDDMLRSDDVAELLRMLETTPYADIARQARRIYEEQQDLFALDAALDRRYLFGLNQHIAALDADDQRVLRTLAGSIIDRFNLVWLMRYRLAYNLTPAETYYLLVPGGHRVRGSDLQALAQLGSFEEMLRALPPPLNEELVHASCISTVDRLLETQVCATAQSILTLTAFNLARAFAYLVLRERDLLQIHAVLKGKRMQLTPESIRLALWAPLKALTPGPSPASGRGEG